MTAFRRFAARALLFALLCQLGACAASGDSPGVYLPSDGAAAYLPPQNSQEGFSDEGRIVYLYLVLTDALGKGDTEAAIASIQELIYLAPTEELFREAVSILEFSGKEEQAIDVARTGVRLYPLDLALHMMFTELLARNGQVDEAVEQLKAFSAFYKKNQTGLSQQQKQSDLGELRLLLIRIFMSDQRFTEAEAVIRGLPARERSSATVMFYEAQILKSTKRDAAATGKLHELVARHPNFTEGWMALAVDSESAKRYQEATSYYRKALDSNDMPQIFLLMLNAMISDKQYRSAVRTVLNSYYQPEVKVQAARIFADRERIKECREILLAVEKDPAALNTGAMDEAKFYLSILDYDSGADMERALERLDEVSVSAGNTALVLHLKAMLQLKTGNLVEAEKTATRLRDESPTLKDNWLFLAEIYNYAKKYPEAESIAREALRQWPDDDQLLYALGAALAAQKKNDESVAAMEAILQQDADNAMALNFIGYLLAEKKKDLDLALEMVSRAMTIEPHSYHIADSLAWVHYQLGNYDQAWDAIRLSIQLGAHDAVVWEHYGDIAAALDKKREAAQAYRKALALDPENKNELQGKLQKMQQDTRSGF
ncbi:MAG: tetratricopeptide repeat protein [Deltaproteobacteria bacterium]|jgi:tetratricopeptide (TPR) repeat protein|nr:tetratricopeptide repeat protein [Deltaproteobacteria bacterium]